MSTESKNEGGRGHSSPYLVEVERRKKAPVLLHEQGLGAPCLKCGEDCSGGFSLHYWRKVCMNCRCSRDDHDIPPEEDPGIAKIGKLFDDRPVITPKKIASAKGSTSSLDSQDDTAKRGTETRFEWVPPGVSAALAEKYMHHLPKEHRPLIGSVGAENRKKQLEIQLPSHDFDSKICDSLSPNEVQKLDNYVEEVKKYVVGQAIVEELPTKAILSTCHACGSKLDPGQVAIRADKVGAEKLWHPHCFCCHQCKELLVDLIYFHKDKKLYCGRHYAETTLPRCSACDELIFAVEYTQAEGQFWHFKHFACWNCDVPLANRKYVPREGKPHCLDCYDMLFGKVCLTCRCKIAAGSPRVCYGDNNYHADEKCFKCCNCQVPLMDKKFISKPPNTYCSAECKHQYESKAIQ